MLPIFKKMKIRSVCVVFVISIMSGAMNVTPWCASMLRVTSVTGLDAQELWRYLAPIQAFAIIGFIVAFGLALIANFRTVREQGAAIRSYGGPAINMVMTIITIGVLIGVMNGTGMIEGMTNAILSILPESLGRHLCFIVSLFIVPINTIIGSDNIYFAITPIMQSIVGIYGVTNFALATSIVIPCALAAGITLIGPSPYLALGLADVTMGDHLKYSFKWIWLLAILCTVFGAIIGRIPV